MIILRNAHYTKIFNKKRCLTFILAFVTLVLAVFYIPYPKHIDLCMNGIEVSSGGTVLGNVTFTVEGWLLNYLFREDSLKVEISFEPEKSSPFLYTETRGPLHEVSPDYYCSTCSTYDFVQNFVSFGFFGLSRDFSKCIIRMEDTTYVGSLDGKTDPAELMSFFSELQ